MPRRDIRDLEPFNPDLGGPGGVQPGTGGTPPPPTGGSTQPTGGTSGSSPWPAWAMAIDSNVQGWRTLDGGHLLHKATNRVYSPTGGFVASLSDYLAGVRDDTGMNPDGPPSNGTPGSTWTDPETGEEWEYYLNLGWMKNTPDPKNPNELPDTVPGGLGGNTGGNDPGDGPIPGGPGGGPGPTVDYIGLPPPTGSSGGNGGIANPMPEMPGMGVSPNSPYLGLSRGSGLPVGQREAFKPWGQPLGYLSQALRYGGAPQQFQMGGYEGMDAVMAAAQAAALRGEG